MEAETAVVAVDLRRIANTLRLSLPQVESVVSLLDAQNTVPFITRYRKDQTGGLDEEQIRGVQAAVAQARSLADRKQTILRSIESQGKLSPELRERIEQAISPKVLEDLYLPFKPKKQTLAVQAREKGLEPLAREILAADPLCADLDKRAQDFVDADKKVATAAEALMGAGHVLAEEFSENAELRGKLRQIVRKTGKLTAAAVEGIDQEKAKEFRDYFAFSEPVDRIPPHRTLALNRGERGKILKIKLEADVEQMSAVVDQVVVPEGHVHAAFLKGCGQDALSRLILPSLEREVRHDLTDKAENHAVEVFARNLRNLLLQPPVRGRRLLAIDPGLKTGCKLAALDEFGALLEHGVVYLVGKEEVKAAAPTKMAELIRKHNLSVIVIGNGTACRETEELVAGLISGPLADLSLSYVVVNEAGASVYSASPQGREELPDLDATVRGTLSIGRRLQDPLSELVKIEPQHLGVGLYQHDVKQKHLQQSLDEVVESAVNYVGVDLNTASAPLLRYVSGLNQLVAKRIVEHRTEKGPFKLREQLKDVAGIGGVTFTQAAGFLKISEGDDPLDASWIHPEHYEVARRLLEWAEVPATSLRDPVQSAALAEKLNTLDTAAAAVELGVGELTLKDIIRDLVRPGRDPREDLPAPIFKKGILKVEDLAAGMELMGTVLNVVDFGAFVDVGLKDSGLVHISELANQFVRNPHEVVAVGDVVKVWVLGVDKDRRRVSLTMIAPGTKVAHPPRERGKRGPGAPREGQPQGAAGAPGEPRPEGQSAPRPAGERRERPPRDSQPREGDAPREGGQRRPEGAGAGAGRGGPPRDGGAPRGDGPRGGGDRRPRRDGPSGPPQPQGLVAGKSVRPSRGGPRGGQGGPGGRGGKDGPRKPTNDELAAQEAAAKLAPSKPKAAPKKPGITDGMKQGKEPLRSFGDLFQMMQPPAPPAAVAPAAPASVEVQVQPAAAPVAESAPAEGSTSEGNG